MYNDKLKIRMLIYLIVTALTSSYLVMAENSGIGVVVFAILQAFALYFVIPEKKKLIFYIPVVIISLNFFISGNRIFAGANFVVCLVLYSAMFVKFDLKNTSLVFIRELFERIFQPLGKFYYPVEWACDLGHGKSTRLKRVLVAVGISIVTVALLCLVLSGADMVFGKGVENVLNKITDVFSFNSLIKVVAGFLIGIYLFGVIATGYEDYDWHEEKTIKGDLIIISTVLMSVLMVYTVFVFIQFKYLFSGGSLPYGLNVTEYARKGFFELLGLSVVNIGAILLVTKLTGHLLGKKMWFIKVLDCYLCAVTVVLLASSFYRMWLYNQADGLTRLRFMVFGFLIFEAIGLLITFFYIIKPNFNVVMVYFAIALFYYMILNVVPMDKIIAKNQADRFLLGERGEITYMLTLSSDAASEVERVYKNTEDENVKEQCINWFRETQEKYKSVENWQKYNLSYEKCLMSKD
ncbi:MAG: DUF4153 domain-containing protein [Clostridia bacterium]